MRWRAFLPLLALVYMTRGCGSFDPPYTFYVESSFSDAELDQILWAFDKWNEAIAQVEDVSGPVLIYGGRVTDDFTVEDLNDGRHVIYRVTEQPRAFRDVDGQGGQYTGGHGVDEDIHVMQYNFADWDEALWMRMLQVIVLHELGHTPFGLMHFTHRQGIMNPVISKETFQFPRITKADMEQFCIAHGCDASGFIQEEPPPAESRDIPAIITDPDTGEPIEDP